MLQKEKSPIGAPAIQRVRCIYFLHREAYITLQRGGVKVTAVRAILIKSSYPV